MRVDRYRVPSASNRSIDLVATEIKKRHNCDFYSICDTRMTRSRLPDTFSKERFLDYPFETRFLRSVLWTILLNKERFLETPT